jgi:hypothetical protein
MGKFAKTVKHELAEMIPPTIYFFVIFHIIALIRELMTKNTGIDISTTTSIAIGSLILGKAVLIANALPFINRFPEKPLMWNVCWKTALYFVVALVIHYLEHLYDFWQVAPGFAAANRKLLSEIVWPHFWAIQILLTVLIFVYCVASELARLVGPKKLGRMFFGPVPAKPERLDPSGSA